MTNRCCVVVFSKDRPLQLYATLESFQFNVLGIEPENVFIILKASSSDYRKQYRKVKFAFSKYVFIEEKTDFRQDLVGIVANPFYTHVLFSVDDNVFLRQIDVSKIMDLLSENPKVVGFSLRLGTNVKFCHTQNKNQSLTSFSEVVKDSVLMWDWRESQLDFGYALEISSSIYRTSLIKNLCQKLEYTNPNTLEHQLDLYKEHLSSNYPWLMSYKISKCMCIPMNLTQNEYKNRHSQNSQYTIENLLKTFQQGQKMKLSKLYDFIPKSPHVEINYHFMLR